MRKKVWTAVAFCTLLISAFNLLLSVPVQSKTIRILPNPGKALDKASFERFVKNPNEWIGVTLRMEYFGPAGESLLFNFQWWPNHPVSAGEFWVYQAMGVDQYFSERLAGKKDAVYPVYAKADVQEDGEGINKILLLMQNVNLFSNPLPCSICEKGWIDSRPELYEKGKECFYLHIRFVSKEEEPNRTYPKMMNNVRYGMSWKTDFPEPKNEEEKKALSAVREILKYAKEKFIDYGMKNYWCKKEYKGGKIVKAEPGNQPIPKYKECKADR